MREPAQSKCTCTCYKSHFAREFECCRPRTGTKLCASLRSRNANGHFTKSHFVRALLAGRAPQCGHGAWGKIRDGSLNVTSLCARRTLTWNILGYPPMSSKLKHGGRLWQGKARKMRRCADFGKILATTGAKRAKKQFAHTILNGMRYYPFT